ncbi:MAG: BTAD domain-containing putative transcriptional regulator [Chloroflexota bacterium]
MATESGDEQPFTLRLLDAFDLAVDGGTAPLSRAGRRLVAFVALSEKPVDRHRLAGTLWPESPEQAALALLRTTLWRLDRQAPGVVVSTPTTVRMNELVEVDLRLMRSVASQLIRGSASVDQAAADMLVSSRELLPDWSEDWVLPERERFRQLRLHALEQLCRQLVAEGKHGLAIEAGMAAVAEEPLRESARKVLIAAFLAEGNPSEAIRELARYRRTVVDELGVEPALTLESRGTGFVLLPDSM